MADEDGHVFVTEQNHVSNSVGRILAALLSAFHKEIIDLKASILDLFFCLLCFCKDWACLWVIITICAFEVCLKVFIALVNNSDHIYEGWSFL